MRTVLNSLRHLRLRTNSFKSPSLFSSKIAWICMEMSDAGTCTGTGTGTVAARACTCTGTGGKDIGIVTVGSGSTIVTVLPFEFLEVDAALILLSVP